MAREGACRSSRCAKCFQAALGEAAEEGRVKSLEKALSDRPELAAPLIAIAAGAGHLDTLEWLLNRDLVSFDDEPLAEAAGQGRFAVMERLANDERWPRRNVSSMAAKEGRIDVMERLVARDPSFETNARAKRRQETATLTLWNGSFVVVVVERRPRFSTGARASERREEATSGSSNTSSTRACAFATKGLRGRGEGRTHRRHGMVARELVRMGRAGDHRRGAERSSRSAELVARQGLSLVRERDRRSESEKTHGRHGVGAPERSRGRRNNEGGGQQDGKAL